MTLIAQFAGACLALLVPALVGLGLIHWASRRALARQHAGLNALVTRREQERRS